MRKVKTISIAIPKDLNEDIEKILEEVNLQSEEKFSKSQFITECIIYGLGHLLSTAQRDKGGKA